MGYITSVVGTVYELSENWEKGISPVGGGSMSQMARGMAGIRILKRAREHCRGLLDSQARSTQDFIAAVNGGAA